MGFPLPALPHHLIAVSIQRAPNAEAVRRLTVGRTRERIGPDLASCDRLIVVGGEGSANGFLNAAAAGAYPRPAARNEIWVWHGTKCFTCEVSGCAKKGT